MDRASKTFYSVKSSGSMGMSDQNDLRLEPKNIDITVPQTKVTTPAHIVSSKKSDTIQNDFKEFTIEDRKSFLKSLSQPNSPRSQDLHQPF